MTDIPRARRLIAKALDMLMEAESLMTRPAPIRKAKASSTSITPELAGRIRSFAKKWPKLTYRDIGLRFNVDGGRVSEILRGLR